MAAILKVWRQIEIRLRYSMRIYFKNNPAKFYPVYNPVPIWYDGASDVFEECCPKKKNKKKNKMSSDMGSVSDPEWQS